MSEKRDLVQLFKNIASRVDKRDFPNVTREAKISELGIDSLSVMQIIGELETELGIVIPDEDLVEMITVGDLVKHIEKQIR